MTLIITLTPEEEARLRQEAVACGLETHEYARRLLPVPPPKARTRESLYEDGRDDLLAG